MKFRSQDHLLFNMSTVVNTKVGTHWKLLKQMVTKPSQTRGGEGGGVLSSTELQKNWTIVFPMLMKICRWRLYREESTCPICQCFQKMNKSWFIQWQPCLLSLFTKRSKIVNLLHTNIIKHIFWLWCQQYTTFNSRFMIVSHAKKTQLLFSTT